MISPISPLSSSASNRTGTKNKVSRSTSLSPLKSGPLADHVRFSGKPNTQQPSKWQKYGWPGIEVATGTTIAALGLPLHILPGIGNALGFGLHLLGGLLAIHGAYTIYQRATHTDDKPDSQTTTQPSGGRKNTGGRSRLGTSLVNNAITGAVAGGAAGGVQEGIHALVNRNDNDDGKTAEHEAGSDQSDQEVESEQGDGENYSDDDDFGDDGD